MTKPREKTREERRERNHRLIVRGAVFESIVPEAKTMTDADPETGCMEFDIAKGHFS